MTHSPMEYVTIVIDDTNRQMAKKTLWTYWPFLSFKKSEGLREFGARSEQEKALQTSR